MWVSVAIKKGRLENLEELGDDLNRLLQRSEALTQAIEPKGTSALTVCVGEGKLSDQLSECSVFVRAELHLQAECSTPHEMKAIDSIGSIIRKCIMDYGVGFEEIRIVIVLVRPSQYRDV